MPDQPASNQPATLFRRVFAYFIDSFVIAFFTAIAFYLLIEKRNLEMAIGVLVIGGMYKPLFEARFGWTLGKLSQRLFIVDQVTGKKPDLNQSLMRYLPWAIGVFASIFVIIRHFESPGFKEVQDVYQYLEFSRKSVLSSNFLLQVISNLPIFSGVWLIADPRRQALHDKLAKTLVVSIRKN